MSFSFAIYFVPPIDVRWQNYFIMLFVLESCDIVRIIGDEDMLTWRKGSEAGSKLKHSFRPLKWTLAYIFTLFVLLMIWFLSNIAILFTMNIFFASLLSSLTLICATPLPQDPGDSTIMEPFITGDNVDKNLQRPNLDLTSTNTLEGIEQADITALNGDCEVQSSTAGLSDVKDENSVYKRATTSCPVNAGGNSVIVAPFGRVLQTAPERLPVPKGSDIACVKYRGKGLTKHVSCGGPIIGTVADIVKTILNCIPGRSLQLHKFFQKIISWVITLKHARNETYSTIVIRE